MEPTETQWASNGPQKKKKKDCVASQIFGEKKQGEVVVPEMMC
jgi:hypothetical protein